MRRRLIGSAPKYRQSDAFSIAVRHHPYVAKAKEFSVGFLGFAVDWEHRFDEITPAYMQLSRGDLLLHLTEPHGDCCPGSPVFVWMTGIDEFHREVSAKG